MPQISCSECNADVEEDLLASTGVAECPFCGANLAELLKRSAPAKNMIRETIPEKDSRDDAPPPSSRIVVDDTHAPNKIIFVPSPKKGDRTLLFYCILWNGTIMLTIFQLLSGNLAAGAGATIELMVFLLVGLFWAAGLGLLYFYLSMRFTRCYLLLNVQQISLQKILFNTKKQVTISIHQRTRAELKEVSTKNDVTEYCILIAGENRKLTFGGMLTRKEKAWLLKTINQFLKQNKNSIAAPVNVLPDGSQLAVVESDVQKKLLFIPVKGRLLRKLFNFGIFSFLIMSTIIGLTNLLMRNANVTFIDQTIFILLASMFFIAGTGSCCWWFKLLFTQTHLLLEHDRVTLQKVFFEKYSDQELLFSDKTKAALKGSFKLNDERIYTIEMRSGKQKLHFGTFLTEQEKYWLVDFINEFIKSN